MNKKAFTLVEIMVALAILMLIIATLFPVFNNIIRDVKVKRMKVNMEGLKKQVLKYRIKYSAYPSSLLDLEGEFIIKVPMNPVGNVYRIAKGSDLNYYIVSDSNETSAGVEDINTKTYRFSLYVGHD